MPPVISNLLASKKFIFVLVISVLAGLGERFGLLTKSETMGLLGVLWPVYLGAQGFGDIGQKLADAHILVQTRRDQSISEDAIKDREYRSSLVTNLMPGVLATFEKMVPQPHAYRVPLSPNQALVLLKGAKVLHLDYGPDEIGEVLEDQTVPLRTPDDLVNVRVKFPSAHLGGPGKDPALLDENTYDRRDLLAVSADYVGPTEQAKRAKVAPAAPAKAS